jgi:hypothetical protein
MWLPSWRHFDPTDAKSWFVLFCACAPVLAIYSAPAAVISVWAGFGMCHLRLRLAVAIALQLGLSLILSLALVHSLNEFQLMSLVRSQLAETVAVIGSLLVVRSCGYGLANELAGSTDWRICVPSPKASHELDGP